MTHTRLKIQQQLPYDSQKSVSGDGTEFFPHWKLIASSCGDHF